MDEFRQDLRLPLCLLNVANLVLALVATGSAFGFAGTIGLRQSLQSQLFGVGPADPAVLALMVKLLAIVSLAACTLPARRATRIDPIVAPAE